jgi:hypothetical protein
VHQKVKSQGRAGAEKTTGAKSEKRLVWAKADKTIRCQNNVSPHGELRPPVMRLARIMSSALLQPCVFGFWPLLFFGFGQAMFFQLWPQLYIMQGQLRPTIDVFAASARPSDRCPESWANGVHRNLKNTQDNTCIRIANNTYNI